MTRGNQRDLDRAKAQKAKAAEKIVKEGDPVKRREA